MVKDDLFKKVGSAVARSDDGTIQITFTIPFELIKEKREEAAKALSDNTNVPGFRKGKAPVDKILDHVSPNTILEKTLSFILPQLIVKAVEDNKIKPVIYPKFELIKAEENEDWQIRAVTCEAPLVNLGNYKKDISNLMQNKKTEIWTPASDNNKTAKAEKSVTREEKEQMILKTLIDSAECTIPNVLIQEEADHRLSNLLSRLEKLGLSLESYLSSTGKNADGVRKEYEKQALEGLKVDFILSKIAENEKITIENSVVDASIKAATQDEKSNEGFDSPERRKFIEIILKRRKALDLLLSYI